MNNMMKEYLGAEYSKDHLKNFCLYWMKGRKTQPLYKDFTDKRKYYSEYYEWRVRNDLDCLYFNGDLRADTLMSAWTPIKWVAECLNAENGKKFYKTVPYASDPSRDLKFFSEERDIWLPRDHELVCLLDEFLELAELRCNYILLPDRRMNNERYNLNLFGEELPLYDMVPATLYYLFEPEALGRYFRDENGVFDVNKVVSWVERENLQCGFENEIISQEKVIPLLKETAPGSVRPLTEEEELKTCLEYMINILEKRMKAFRNA